MKKENKIILSEKDQKIFFDAIIKPSKPNKFLRKAVIRYKKYCYEKDR